MFGNIQISFNDLMQILILYWGIYAIIRFVRGTRNAQVLLGLGVVVASFLIFTYIFRFDVLARIVYFLLIFLAISMVVVFQQEIRRVLALVGGQRFFDRQYTLRQPSSPEKLCQALLHMGQEKIGALVAIERGISLCNYEDSGIKVDAALSHELLVSIFTPPLPLHDGGIILRNGRIAAAHCLFPVSIQSELAGYGMRHRAAVGLSEETDAVVVVVSEEIGTVSVAHNGKLFRYEGDKVERMLRRWLRKAMPEESQSAMTFSDWLSVRLSKLIGTRPIGPRGDLP